MMNEPEKSEEAHDDVAERCAKKAAAMPKDEAAEADAKAVAERCAAKAAAAEPAPDNGEPVVDAEAGDSEKAAAEELEEADDAAAAPAEGDDTGEQQ